MPTIKQLIDKLDVFTEYDRDDYTEIEVDEVEALTDKGVKLFGTWFGLSTLRTDMDGGLFIENWLYDRYFT